LLRWNIENSTPGTTINTLDPGMITSLVIKPDAQLMKEALTIGLDERQTEDDRLKAL
ncbi:uncharacterized protein BJ212DRAFT_1246897, partial [Suillus subaureus]